MFEEENKQERIRKVFFTLSLFLYFLLFIFFFYFRSANVIAGNLTSSTIISDTNYIRAKYNLHPLKENPELTAAAYLKAYDMFNDQYWDHISPDGKTPWYFIRNTNYDFRFAGENLAKDFSSSEDVIAAWMESPDHRANILNPNYEDIGVAIVKGRLNGKETTLIVAIYGAEYRAQNKNSENNIHSRKITIRYPLDSETINDRGLTILGTVCCFKDLKKLLIYDNGLKIGEVNLKSDNWFFQPEQSFADGKHHLVVYNSNDIKVFDEVTFWIKSSPPTINRDDIYIKRRSIGYNVTFKVRGDADKVIILFNNNVFHVVRKEEGEYSVTLPFADKISEVLILVSDKNNNVFIMNISDMVKPVNSRMSLLLGNILMFFHRIKLVYVIIFLVLLFIFVIDIMLYRKYQLVKYFGQDLLLLFAIFTFFLIEVVTQFVGGII